MLSITVVTAQTVGPVFMNFPPHIACKCLSFEHNFSMSFLYIKHFLIPYWTTFIQVWERSMPK